MPQQQTLIDFTTLRVGDIIHEVNSSVILRPAQWRAIRDTLSQGFKAISGSQVEITKSNIEVFQNAVQGLAAEKHATDALRLYKTCFEGIKLDINSETGDADLPRTFMDQFTPSP